MLLTPYQFCFENNCSFCRTRFPPFPPAIESSHRIFTLEKGSPLKCFYLFLWNCKWVASRWDLKAPGMAERYPERGHRVQLTGTDTDCLPIATESKAGHSPKTDGHNKPLFHPFPSFSPFLSWAEQMRLGPRKIRLIIIIIKQQQQQQQQQQQNRRLNVWGKVGL